jgi:xanthine dehydrogenase iron-sulfur cluster and FAD-binding subunit A
MWSEYFSAHEINEVIDVLAEREERARVIAGGTDLLLEIERRVRKGIDTLIDISRIPDLDRINLDHEEYIHLGPLVTHNHCIASKLIINNALPLAQAASEVGAPQIRNRGTIAGNLITASPANDTITPLIAMNAEVVLQSQGDKRIVPLHEFYTGVRKIVMYPDEMLIDIRFRRLSENQRGQFYKLGLRRAQAISLVNAACVLKFEENPIDSVKDLIIQNATITLGAVAPTIIRATDAEEYLVGKVLTDETIESASQLAQQAAMPIDDVRSSRDYRSAMVRVCVLRALRAILRGDIVYDRLEHPVLLWGNKIHKEVSKFTESFWHSDATPIITRVNGKQYIFKSGHRKTLLRLLREDAGLIGTKEGCAEGECGACTVFLDGKAVMSCLVPAARAHGAEIITIEGLGQKDDLHPVQQAFIEYGAVQCGYCTPGFIMSAAKLFEENPHPSHDQIKQAITGNLCRCTGYYKIVDAIESVYKKELSHG